VAFPLLVVSFSLSKGKKRFFLSVRSCFNGVLLLLSPEEKDAVLQRQSRVGTRGDGSLRIDTEARLA
jgi:hypothetical protein